MTIPSINQFTAAASQLEFQQALALFLQGSSDMEGNVTALQSGQGSSVIGYATQALLYADLMHAANTVGYVTNDAVPANNGVYIKSGASGAGAWSPSSFDRILGVENSVVAVQSRYGLKDNGKNLLNPNDPNIVIGQYLDASGGLQTNALLATSGFIQIANGQTLTCSLISGGGYNCLYDANFVLVSSVQFSSALTGTAATAYARFSFGNVNVNQVQIENGIVSTAIVPYTESNVIDRAIGGVNLTVSEKADKTFSRNLLNPNDQNIILNGFINASGVVVPNVNGFDISGYIPIMPGQTLTGNFSASNVYAALYDTILSYIAGTAINAVTITNNTGIAQYARFSIPGGFVQGSVQVESGATSTGFVPYTETFALDAVNLDKISKRIGKNLFNPNDPDLNDGHYLTNNASIGANAFFGISGKIPISVGQTLTANFSVANTYVCLYDVNGIYIAGSSVNSNSISYVAGAVYALFSYLKPIDKFQIEVGAVSTAYTPYTDLGDAGSVLGRVPDREVSVILPAHLYFVKGLESCIYEENILNKQIGHPAKVLFDLGFDYERLANLNFTASVVGGTLTASIQDNFKEGNVKSLIYDVKDPVLNNGKVINILNIGDSFTDIGTWNSHVTSLLAADGVTVNEIGTTGKAVVKSEGHSGGTLLNTFLDSSAGVARIVAVTGVTQIPQTGYPGTFYTDAAGTQWTIRGGKINGAGTGHVVVTNFGAVAGDFATFPVAGNLTKVAGQAGTEGDAVIAYTNPIAAYYNPFINHTTGVLDIASYITFWGFNAPDVVAFQFTWNDTQLWESDTGLNTVVANFKLAADHVHAAYPLARVVFSIEPFGQINKDRDANGKKYTVLRLVELMLVQFEADAAYNTWVTIAPSYAFVDCIYGYSSATVAPCAKYPAVTEQQYGGSGVHPSTTGMQQIGECVYQVVSNII